MTSSAGARRRSRGNDGESKEIDGAAEFAGGFAAAGGGVPARRDGFEDVGGVIARSTLGTDAGGDVFDENVLALHFAGQPRLFFMNGAVAVLARFVFPEG